MTLKTAVHPRQPRPAPMFTPLRAGLRNHPLGEVRSSCAAQSNWASHAAPAFPTAGFRETDESSEGGEPSELIREDKTRRKRR